MRSCPAIERGSFIRQLRAGDRSHPFDNRSNGGIVSIDDFEVTELLALGEAFGLLTNLLMMTHRGEEFLAKPLTLSLIQCRRLLQARLGLLAQGCDILSHIKELLFGLANQFDEDFALTATATAKAAHDLAETLLQVFNLDLHSRAATTAMLGDADNEV